MFKRKIFKRNGETTEVYENEVEIMEKFYKEINEMSKEELLSYMSRIISEKEKHERKYKRMMQKYQIIKEKIRGILNNEWIEQRNGLNENSFKDV
jgi:hypothetical protein